MNSINSHSIKQICEKKLSIAFRSNGHFVGWILLDGIKTARITVPKGRKSIGPKLYKSTARQLELETEQFDKLLACPMTAAQYMRIVKK
jgi:hypothetical protein